MSSVRSLNVSADGAVQANAGAYMGFNFTETTGLAGAHIRVYDNTSAASGTLLESVKLAAGESVSDWYGPNGIRCANGIYVDVVTGSVEGGVRYS